MDSDFDNNLINGEYDPEKFYQDEELGVTDKLGWGNLVLEGTDVKLSELFPYIYHPAYAFKYYEYPPRQADLEPIGTDPKRYDALIKALKGIERSNCFGNPNFKNDGTPGACGFESDGVTSKPCDFCGKGEIKCNYYKENWSCEQRKSFYEIIKGFNLEFVDEEPDFDKDDTDLNNITCSWLRNEDLVFYEDKGEDEEGKDISNQSQLSYLTEDLYKLIYSNEPDDDLIFSDGGKSYIQLVSEKFSKSCRDNCELRESEFRLALFNMFADRCYDVGGCKESVDGNVITEEMIDALVAELVSNCKSQCPITTFTCEDIFCVSVEDPLDIWNISDVKYGVGGHIDAASNNDCPSATSGVNDCNEEGPFDLTFSELTKWKQARYWPFDVSVPTKCNEDGVFDPENPVGQWIWVNGKLVLEDPDANVDCDAPDTFVERDEYVRQSDEIIGSNSNELKKIVKSPKIGFHKRIDP